MGLTDPKNKANIQILHPPTYSTGRKRNSRIALAQRLPEPQSSWRERLYRLPDFLAQIDDLRARELTQDLFFSLNAFGKYRRLEHLTELLALFADLDCYQQRMSPEFTRLELSDLILEGRIPKPNIIAYSGRGLWTLWLLEAAPKASLPLWSALMDHFIAQMRDLGADTKARDASRIIRVPGSWHSDANVEVVWEVLHDHRYRLDWLRDEYLPTLPAPSPKKPNNRVFVHQKFMSLFSLHMGMIEDLKSLAELRGRDLRGHREFFLFIWRNCLVRLGYSPEESEREIRGVALTYLGDEVLPDREWMRQTMSAHKAKHKTKDGDEANGYTLSGAWIMDRLAITEDEQRHMKVLIGRKEKYRRNNERRYKKTRAEYIAQCAEMRSQIRRAKGMNPYVSNRELAALFGVSKDTVRNALKEGG